MIFIFSIIAGLQCPVNFLLYSKHQKSAIVSHEMSGLNWKPFVYGGLASIVAEFDSNAGSRKLVPRQHDWQLH